MDPTVLYILLIVMAVAVCSSSVLAWKPPMRACQMCGRQTSQLQRQCRHCGRVTNR